MRSCPVPNRYWRRLVNKLGNEDIAYNLYFSKGDSVYDMSDEELSRYTTTPEKIETESEPDTLFGMDTGENMEFHVNTLNLVSNFLDNIGVEQRLVPEILNEYGNPVEGAIAVANFMNASVDIIDDVNDRADAWNKLPEEAAHWWYRLLKKDSPLKQALWESAKTGERLQELLSSQYGEYYDAENLNASVIDTLNEEAVGQLVAEAIKKVEERNAAAADYNFLQVFLDWVNKVIKSWTDSYQDPFEVAAIKILNSDMTDLMSVEEYKALNDAYYFNSVAPQEDTDIHNYTIISDLGNIITVHYGYEPNEVTYQFQTKKYKTIEKEIDNYDPDDPLSTPFPTIDIDYVRDESLDSPEFNTREELHDWIVKNVPEYSERQKIKFREVEDYGKFLDRLLNKTFKVRTKFLNKTLDRYYSIYNPFKNLNSIALQQSSYSSFKSQIGSLTLGLKQLTNSEKQDLFNTNSYTNITPTLKVLPAILEKYKKNPIVLSETLKIDGIKKKESKVIQNVIDLIKGENPDLRTITAEELVNEVHNFLELNYLLGFGHETKHLNYRISDTFKFLNGPDGDIRHDKISIRFNDRYHEAYTHFNYSPSAWGNLTAFRTSPNSKKNAVLLHEIQNDNIERLRKQSNTLKFTGDLDSEFSAYLTKLYEEHEKNKNLIETSGVEVSKFDIDSFSRQDNIFDKVLAYINQTTTLDDVGISFIINELKQKYEEIENLNPIKNFVQRKIDLNKTVNSFYSAKRKALSLRKNGGIAALLTDEEKQRFTTIINRLNQKVTSQREYDPDFGESWYEERPATIDEKKDSLTTDKEYLDFVNLIADRVTKTYGENNFFINDIKNGLKSVSKKPRTNDLNPSIKVLSTQLNRYISKELEKFKLKSLDKEISQYYKQESAAFFAHNINKLSNENWITIINNVIQSKTNLEKAIDERIAKRLSDDEYKKLTPEEKETLIQQEIKSLEKVKEESEKTLEDYRENISNVTKESADMLDVEMEYFTPLVHHLIQTHIKQYGKNTPLYFSGYQITQLTQGNNRTAAIYAGKDEVKFTKEQADEIKYNAAVNLNLVQKTFPVNKEAIQEGIKKLAEFKRLDEKNQDKVYYEINKLSNNKPIETGALYNAMSQVAGVKLIWQNNIEGFDSNVGGYLVDLSEYNFQAPMLYSMKPNPGSYSRYRPSSTISILKQVKFRESIKPGDVTSFTYWSETTSKLVSEKDIVVESVGNDYFEGRYPNGEGRTFKYKNIVDDSIQGTLTTFEQKQFKDRLMLGQTIFVKTNIGDFNGQVTSIEEDSFSVDNQQINYSDVFKEEPQLAFLQNIQDLKETISNQIVVYQSKMKTVDQKKRVESLRRALEMLEGYKEYNDLIGFFAEVRSNIDDTKALLKAVVDPEKKYTPEKILYIISYAKDFLDSYFHLRGLNNSIQNFEGSEELKAISNQLFADLENTKQEYFNVALPQLRDVLWEQFDMNTNNQLAAAGEKIYTKERLLEELKNPTRDLDYFNKFFVAPINSNDIILGLFSKMLKKGKEAARKINELLIRDLTPMVNSLKKKYDLKELMKNFYTITEETIFEDGKPRIIRVRRFIQKYNQKKYYDETNLMYQERQRAIDDINLAEAAGDATARENALGRYKIINEKLNAYKRLNGVQITASQFKAKMEKLKALNDDDFIKNLARYYTATTEAESDENSIVTENELTGEKTYYRYTNKRWEANKEMFITDEYKRLQTLFDRDPEVKRFFEYLMDKYEEANRKIPEAYRLRGVVPSVYETNFLNSIKKGWKNFWRTNEKQLMVRLDGKPYKEIPIGFTKLIDIDESSDDILRSTMLFLAEANNFGEMSRYLGTADTLVEALEAKYPLDSSQKQKMFSSMNNRLDAVKRTIDQTLYGIHKDSYGLGSKILDLLNKFTSFTRIALKPLNWISNILVGNMGNLSEAVGGRHFGVRDIMWAQKEMFKLMFTNPKKFANMIRSLDAVQGRFLKEFGDEFISFREKYVAWDTMFIGQDMGELQIQGTAMLAYLRARKIPIPADGNFDLDSLPPDFINTLHAINKHNHGVYNNFDRLYLQTNALFRLMLQFRKYIVPTFRARYDGLFSGNNRVDWESGTVEKGWWRIWGEYHYNTIKNWKQMPSFIASFNSLTDAEKEGVRRAYFDAAAYTLLYGLFVMMKPDDDDEEEETSKFEWHVLYQLEKLKGDYGLIFPLGGFEDKLRLLSNPFAAAPVAADSLAILSQVTNFEPDKEGNVSIYQRYQRDTGYYKKGDLKILGKVSKINGFDNFIQSEDPKTALQAYLAAARR